MDSYGLHDLTVTVDGVTYTRKTALTEDKILYCYTGLFIKAQKIVYDNRVIYEADN